MENKDSLDYIEKVSRDAKKKERKLLITIIAVFCGLALLIWGGVMIALTNSDAYAVSVEAIRSNTDVITATVGIDDIGWPSGELKTHNNEGEGHFSINVDGKIKDIEVNVSVYRKGGSKWIVRDLSIEE